ncbi:hypothetical protein EBX31_04295 [bacterium]|nr:hypothetical protein [bacterium]
MRLVERLLGDATGPAALHAGLPVLLLPSGAGCTEVRPLLHLATALALPIDDGAPALVLTTLEDTTDTDALVNVSRRHAVLRCVRSIPLRHGRQRSGGRRGSRLARTPRSTLLGCRHCRSSGLTHPLIVERHTPVELHEQRAALLRGRQFQGGKELLQRDAADLLATIPATGRNRHREDNGLGDSEGNVLLRNNGLGGHVGCLGAGRELCLS